MLAHCLTQEWADGTRRISECPLLVKVTMKELRMGSSGHLNMVSFLTMHSNIFVDKVFCKINVGKLCIIFDGLDEYPPVYNDSIHLQDSARSPVSTHHSYSNLQTRGI